MAGQHDITAESAGVRSMRRPLMVRAVAGARKNPSMAAGIGVVVIMALIAVLAPVLFTPDPNELSVSDRLTPPSSGYWFGSDFVGRDVYSRTMFGSRVSLLVGFSVAFITAATGAMVGVVVGYYRGADAVIMRVMDGLMAIPSIILAMALVALLGGSVQNVIISLSVVETPRAVRIVRSLVLSLREHMFIDAARALGTPPHRILLVHILPNTIAPLIVHASFVCAFAILVEAALSFLGAGTPPEIPSWGTVMADGRRHISAAMWVVLFPGIFLTLTVLGINMAGDGLRDNLDPKLRGR